MGMSLVPERWQHFFLSSFHLFEHQNLFFKPKYPFVLRLFRCCRETCISGCDSMSDIDLLELGSYTELQGGNISLPSGFSSILEPAARDIPEDKILKRHVVSSIKWAGPEWKFVDVDDASDDSERTVVGADRPPPPPPDHVPPSDSSLVEIACDNGKTFLCDHVICTLPLGVLKDKAASLFTPPLPQHKQEAIERLLFGTVNKIFLVYERPFLHPDIEKVMLLWESDATHKGELIHHTHSMLSMYLLSPENVVQGV